MKAIVIGATGATGKNLVQQLLKNEKFSEVTIFVRRKIEIEHPKLKINIINFESYEEWKDLVKGDVLFSCLGTTIKIAGTKEAQWRIDHDYQLQFAKAASQNNVKNYILISSSYAHADSKIFYSQLKGKLEEEIKKLKFKKIFILRPSILIRKNSDRIGEKMGVILIKICNLLGFFKDKKPISVNLLAKALIKIAEKNDEVSYEKSVIILENKKIFEILKN